MRRRSWWHRVLAPMVLGPSLWTAPAGAASDAGFVQIAAPATNPASPALLDRAEFPQGFALALDEPLGDPDAGRAVTLRTTPLAIAGLLGARTMVDAGSPEPSGALSRVGLSTSLGGPTQADDATFRARPRAATNHFTAEVKVSLMGEADRSGAEAPVSPGQRPGALGVCFTADTYATGFGRDLWAVTCIAEPSRAHGLLLNAGYRWEERIHGPRPTEAMVGSGLQWPVFTIFSRPASASTSCSELIRSGRRPAALQGNEEFDVQLQHGLRFSSGVTCANHPVRYPDTHVRGSAGLGVTF